MTTATSATGLLHPCGGCDAPAPNCCGVDRYDFHAGARDARVQNGSCGSTAGMSVTC